MSNKDQSRYNTVFYSENDVYVKTDTATGASWTWKKRPKACRAIRTTSRNGVTVESLVAAGNKVRIRHLRHALYNGGIHMVVPSTFRHDSNYLLLPKGGYTHITIQTKDGSYFCYSSRCSELDPFCYRLGIVTALERIGCMDMEKFYGSRLSD